MARDIYYVKRYKFSNDYGASVVCKDQSWGHSLKLFEVAVLYKGRIVYDTPITDSVVHDCNHTHVARLLEAIKALPPRENPGITVDERNKLVHEID